MPALVLTSVALPHLPRINFLMYVACPPVSYLPRNPKILRRCPLREVRIRGTACTDKSIYMLAQFCPDLEWISYADYSGEQNMFYFKKVVLIVSKALL